MRQSTIEAVSTKRFVVKEGKNVSRFDTATMFVTQADAQRVADELNGAWWWRSSFSWEVGPIAVEAWFVVDTQE
jgi:hypothetical protein